MRTPSLRALKVFEVVARHLSMTEAAQELFVTPSAVSQQIRQLEAELGEPLFIRNGNRLKLTRFGAQCLEPVRDGFERVAVGLDEVYRGRRRRRLSISVAPSFGQSWLLPRLDDFTWRNPDVDVSLKSATELAALEREEVDVAIRYGSGFYPGLARRKLMDERLIAVCAPEVAAFVGNIDDPRSLPNLPLIHEDPLERDPSCPDWRALALELGLEGENFGRGLRMDTGIFAVMAAVQGKGVALAKAQVARPFLEAGQLVRAGGIDRPLDFAYYAVFRRDDRDKGSVGLFLKWLMKQAENA